MAPTASTRDDSRRCRQAVVEGGTGNYRRLRRPGLGGRGREEYVKAYYDNYQNPLQLPFLRIPGTFEYWTPMDVRLSEG